MPDCLEMPYQPAVRGAEIGNNGGCHVYRLGGKFSLSGDYTGDLEASHHELQIGERIVFEDMDTLYHWRKQICSMDLHHRY